MPPREPSPGRTWRFEAIGTQWQVDGQLSDDVRRAVTARIDDFDRTWSRFRADSTVTALAASGGTAATGPETDALLDLYALLHDVTSAAVNPLVGGRLAALGYGPGEGDARPFESLTWTDDTVTLAEPALIDIGAAGKGLLVDLVSQELLAHGVTFHTVDAGSDLVHTGAGSLRVALEHPADPESAIGVVELDPGQSLCASATNRRTWGDGLHHVLDARTGRPTGDVVATWAIAPTAMVADGAATALFFADADDVAERLGCVTVQMRDDGSARWSAGWPGEVFVA